MSDRKENRRYAWYVCGKCKHEIYRLKDEDDIVPCDECGAVYEGTTSSTSNTTTGKAINGGDLSEIRAWEHKTREPSDVPSEVKYEL